MSSFSTYVKKKIREVEAWLALPPDEINWLQAAEDCCSILAEVQKKATLAGVPGAVAACQVRGTSTPVDKTRRILAECLAACPLDQETIVPVLLTVKQAAARYNMGERTLYRLLKLGDLRNSAHGGSKRIKPADLERYLEYQGQPQVAQESLFD